MSNEDDPDILRDELKAALNKVKLLEARVKQLSDQLGLSKLQQREWRHSQADLPEVDELKGLTVGRRVKLTREILIEVHRTHFDRGVNAHRIAKTLKVDPKCIAHFLDANYPTSAAVAAYKTLGITPKWQLKGKPGLAEGPSEARKRHKTQLKPSDKVSG